MEVPWWLNPWLGIWSHKPCSMAKRKKKRKKDILIIVKYNYIRSKNSYLFSLGFHTTLQRKLFYLLCYIFRILSISFSKLQATYNRLSKQMQISTKFRIWICTMQDAAFCLLHKKAWPRVSGGQNPVVLHLLVRPCLRGKVSS